MSQPMLEINKREEDEELQKKTTLCTYGESIDSENKHMDQRSIRQIQVQPLFTVIEEESNENEDEIIDSENNQEVEREENISQSSKTESEERIKTFQMSLQEVPGKLGNSWITLLQLAMNGFQFYEKKQKMYNSTVFKVNLFGQRTMLSDFESMRYIFKTELIKKQPGFGIMKFNYDALPPEYTPLTFQNGERHDKIKNIFLKFMHTFRDKFHMKTLNKIIGHEFEDLSFNVTTTALKFNFEDGAERCLANILTETLLDIKVDFKLLKYWFDKSFIKSYRKYTPPAGLESTVQYLKHSFSKSPVVKILLKENVLSSEEIVLELIMMIIFNAYGGLSKLLISCIICLRKLSNSDRELLQDNAKSVLQGEEIQMTTLSHIEHFVLEVIRLHPPAYFVFGTATQDFLLEGKNCIYQIKNGSLLCGNIYQAQRDPTLFQNSNLFNFHRFEDCKTDFKQYLLAFGGNYYSKSDIFNHKCIGQQLGLTILKLCVCRLLSYDIEIASKLEWTGKNIRRSSASDKALRVRKFEKLK